MPRTKHYTIGVDAGGTKINAGLVFNYQKIIKSVKAPTGKNKKEIINNLIKTIEAIRGNKKISGIGLGLAGEVNQGRGIFKQGPNLPRDFKNIKIKQIISRYFKTKTFIDNDANCFILAETLAGAAQNYEHTLGVTLGTGIGGGIVIDKKLYHGKNDLAGEIGHFVLAADSKLKCGCGHFGHFETLASGQRLVNLEKRIGRARAEKEVGRYLALGLASLIHILNPEAVVLGGGVIERKKFINQVVKQTKKYLSYNTLKHTKIVKAKLGTRAAILGAALLNKSEARNPKSETN